MGKLTSCSAISRPLLVYKVPAPIMWPNSNRKAVLNYYSVLFLCHIVKYYNLFVFTVKIMSLLQIVMSLLLIVMFLLQIVMSLLLIVMPLLQIVMSLLLIVMSVLQIVMSLLLIVMSVLLIVMSCGNKSCK